MTAAGVRRRGAAGGDAELLCADAALRGVQRGAKGYPIALAFVQSSARASRSVRDSCVC